MDGPLAAYFGGEKHESLLFVLVGVAAIAATIWLWRAGSPYRAMGFPLVAIALIQIAVGGSVYVRTDGQVAALAAQLRSDPAAFRAAELPRMERVNANFRVYKLVEIALLAAGIAMTYLFRQREALYAVGIGLLIQAAFMLTLDLFAVRRAEMYVRHIQEQVAPR